MNNDLMREPIRFSAAPICLAASIRKTGLRMP